MKYGLIYIIKNKYHVENLFKVGFTTNSIEDRVHKLNRETSNPGGFQVYAYFPVNDVRAAEILCHNRLSLNGFEKEKEFFRGSFIEILDIVKTTCHQFKPESFILEDLPIEQNEKNILNKNNSLKPVLSYHKNGRISSKRYFKDGAKEGNWVFWYPNGNFKLKKNYERDKKVKAWIFYYKNGRRKIYKDGNRYKSFWENGKVAELGFVKNGKKTGYWKTYNKNGQVISVGSYREAAKYGTWVYYSENGEVLKREVYKDRMKNRE